MILLNKVKNLSLKTQLIIVILFLMLPIIGFMLVISIFSLQNAQARLMDSYGNELNSFVKRIENVDTVIQAEANSFIANNGSELSMSTPLNKLSAIYIIDDLKQTWQKLDMISGAYLKLRDDSMIYTTYDNQSIELDTLEGLKDYIADRDLTENPRERLSVMTKNGDCFWVWNYTYNGYSIGFFTRTDDIIHCLSSSRYDNGEQIYITDLGRHVLSGTEVYQVGSQGEIVSDIDQLSVDYVFFSEDLEDFGCLLFLLIPNEKISETIPFTVRLLSYGGIIALIMIPVLWFAINYLVIKPMERMNMAMKEIEQDHMQYRLDWQRENSREVRYMGYAFNHMVLQIQDLRIQKYETEIKKREIEAVNLRLQINPHLLLNSLNMIASLAKIKDYNTIQKFTMHLSSYFRYALRNPDSMVTLGDEMTFVKSYLDIQKIRYPGAFVSVYNMEDGLENVRIPSLLIENFVENSIKYALKMNEVIEIIIIIRSEENHVVISVIDNGNGMDQEILERLNQGEIVYDKIGKHIGIWNIRRRLNFIYGEDVELNISSERNTGTQVWIKIPKN